MSPIENIKQLFASLQVGHVGRDLNMVIYLAESVGVLKEEIAALKAELAAVKAEKELRESELKATLERSAGILETVTCTELFRKFPDDFQKRVKEEFKLAKKMLDPDE